MLPSGLDAPEELDRDREEDRDDRDAERDRVHGRRVRRWWRAWCHRRRLDSEPGPRGACAWVRCRLWECVPASSPTPRPSRLSASSADEELGSGVGRDARCACRRAARVRFVPSVCSWNASRRCFSSACGSFASRQHAIPRGSGASVSPALEVDIANSTVFLLSSSGLLTGNLLSRALQTALTAILAA